MRRILAIVAMALATALVMPAAHFYLTVAGLGGEDDYTQRFNGLATDLDGLLKKEPGATVLTLSGAQATKANIEARINTIASQAKADDTFVLFLVGHGTYDDIDYKFNLPGRDITATELNSLLNRVPAKNQLVVNATSSSGGAIPVIQKPNRVVVTATKSGTEKNATIFARYWVDAFRDGAADADRNESLTALEAFRYAEKKVGEYYTTQKRLATEHAVLEDTGEGQGEREPSPQNGQGLIAGRLTVLHMGSVADIVNDPAKQQLLKQRDTVQTAIDELKYRKSAMAEDQYNRQMRQYLVELARLQADLDK